jgi:hypothetical protein
LQKIGKWLGVAHRVGQALCYYILPASGILIVCSTIQALSRSENESLDMLEQIKSLNHCIRDSIETLPVQNVPAELLDVDDDAYTPYLPQDPEADRFEADDFTPK